MDAFAGDFARALLKDPNSALYRELRGAENLDENSWRRVDPRDQSLLAMLCDDVLNSQGPRLTYAFLEAGIDAVRMPGYGPLHETLCGPMDDYHERGRWTSAPYFTVALLEIVAPRIAARGQEDAGFLNMYVAYSLSRALLRRLAPAEDVDVSREWPTPSHYLLYELVSLLVSVVRGEQERALPVSGDAQVPLSPFGDHVVGVLGAVMDNCLRAECLDSRFKGYLLAVWWRAFADKYQGEKRWSERVLNALVYGGHEGGAVRNAVEVAGALEHVDIVLRFSPSATRLRERLGIEQKGHGSYEV